MDTASVEVRAQKGKVEDDLPQPSHKRKGETDEETAAMQHVKRGKSVQEEDEAAQKQGPATLEVGRVAFFFRPKVDKGEVGSLLDVQRFYMLLSPSHKAAKSRLCIIGKKRLPSVRRHERFFGFVEAIAEDDKELLEKLGPAQYETKTRGTRHLAPGRVVGQGTYAVLDLKTHTTLAYKLEIPSQPGDAQLEFTIGEVGSFVLTVKNPAGRGPGDPGLHDKARYPPEKQEEFGHYSWIPAKDMQLLDHEHCEFLLVATQEDVAEKLGSDKPEPLEEGSQGHGPSGGTDADEERLLRAMREELQAERLGLDTRPAETGQLV